MGRKASALAPAPDPDFDDFDEDPAPDLDPSLSLPASLSISRWTALQAWEQLQVCLAGQIPREIFKDLVIPAQLVRFDPEAWVFTIEVPTPRLKALWDDRLVLIARRQLVGECARPAGILVTCPEQP